MPSKRDGAVVIELPVRPRRRLPPERLEAAAEALLDMLFADMARRPKRRRREAR